MSNIVKGLTEAVDIAAMQQEYRTRKADILKNIDAYSKKYGIPADDKYFAEKVMQAQDDEAQRAKQQASTDAAKQQQQASMQADKQNVEQLKAQLAQLQKGFDPNYQYSDDYSFVSKQQRIADQISQLKKRISNAEGMNETKEADYGPKFQSAVQALKQMAKQGERKTVWDPVKRVYKTVPVNTPKKEEGVAEEQVDENLRKWFKEKWVRFGPDGKIRGACARGDDSEGKPKCLPQAKAHALGKKGRKYAAAKKRREDPNPERRGPAKNVATKKKSNEGALDNASPTTKETMLQDKINSLKNLIAIAKEQGRGVRVQELELALNKLQDKLDEACWKGYHKEGMKTMFGKKYPNCVKNTNEEQEVEEAQQCPECGGPMFSELLINEKKDACYYKVKSRYKVWPSAYASGALVQCRKKGANNWGTKSESIEEEQIDEKWSQKYKDSINCSNPKGFSQKAHCAGKKKNESAIMKGLK